MNDGKLSCRFICSADLFDQTTVVTISRRFQYLFEQLILSTADMAESDSIENFSLILPEEKEELQRTRFSRLIDINEEGTCVLGLHHY